MSDKFSSKNGVRQQGRALATKTDRLEEQLKQFVEGADRVIDQLQKRVTALEEAVLALVQTVGADVIQESITEQRKINAENRIAAEAAAVKEATEDGYLLPVEAVEETSFIIGVEHDKEGHLLGQGPQQCPFSQLPEPFKTLLLGKKVGDVIETPTGGKFELTGAYRVDEAKRVEVMKAKQEKALAANATPAPTADVVAPANEGTA